MSSTQKKRLEEYARSVGQPVHQIAVGLEQALWESGPNPMTDFADGLEFEGKPMMSPEAQARWEGLGRFRDALAAFLSGKDAAFIGGVAVRSYAGKFRMPLRPTGDFDLLVSEGFLKELTAYLEKQGAVLDSTDEDCYFFYVQPLKFHLDVMTARSPLMKEALATATGANFQGHALKLVTPQVLVAMKVKAHSERRNAAKKAIDRSDVLGLIQSGAASEEEVRKVLARVSPDLLSEFDAILS